ncbi:MAG: hypothetical protein Q9174_002409 [Haloplaca sp. 1 TL-2023]
MNLLYGLIHIIPIIVTLVVLILNAFGVYWQDLGLPNQNSTLQALQYAAKVHELLMGASLTAIVTYRIQHDLSSSRGVPLGFLSAASMFTSPNFVFSKEFYGGLTAKSKARDALSWIPIGLLLVTCFTLTLLVGPSSAVAMIPRLAWWDISPTKAFGPTYKDRVFFNYTQQELWPVDITNHIYANRTLCHPENTKYDYCAVRAMDTVRRWMGKHQNILRPLIRPSFVNETFKMKKPLVQAQCRSYINPDIEKDRFEFPHDELVTPPLDEFRDAQWTLPNDFVINLKGNTSSIGDTNDLSHPWQLFEWYDTASNFSNVGSPSLGAVVMYLAYDRAGVYYNALGLCSFDGRWVPTEYFLDPKDTTTIRQDTPNPMDNLRGPTKTDPKEMVQMRISLDWANTLTMLTNNNEQGPLNTAVNELFGNLGGGNVIYTEPDDVGLGSLDWRLSTLFGLYLTEALARAFWDPAKGSMLYREAPHIASSYIRYLNNANEPSMKEQYRDGKLAWLEMRDPRWTWDNLSDVSREPWDVWALKNGYQEIEFAIQRNGYGYGFEGGTIKLATTVLVAYLLVAFAHVAWMICGSQVYRGYHSMGEMLALAWSSPATEKLKNTSAGVKNLETWRYMVRVRERDVPRKEVSGGEKDGDEEGEDEDGHEGDDEDGHEGDDGDEIEIHAQGEAESNHSDAEQQGGKGDVEAMKQLVFMLSGDAGDSDTCRPRPGVRYA